MWPWLFSEEALNCVLRFVLDQTCVGIQISDERANFEREIFRSTCQSRHQTETWARHRERTKTRGECGGVSATKSKGCDCRVTSTAKKHVNYRINVFADHRWVNDESPRDGVLHKETSNDRFLRGRCPHLTAFFGVPFHIGDGRQLQETSESSGADRN